MLKQLHMSAQGHGRLEAKNTESKDQIVYQCEEKVVADADKENSAKRKGKLKVIVSL